MILRQQNFIVTDNHASNVHAISSLTAIFNSDSHQYIKHPENLGKKTCLFYDTVHIMKNFRNNLLNGKSLFFPNSFTTMVWILISIFQQVLFSGKIYTISMTKTKDCQPIWIRVPNFLTNPCTQGITSKECQQSWQSYMKLPLLLPETIFLLDQIYLNF